MLFIENKYTKIYYSLINKRKRDKLSKDTTYCESHHIIPKSLGGSNLSYNLINLTAREHYIAHKLLTKMTFGENKRKMWWAFHKIIHSKNSEFAPNAKVYEKFRLLWKMFIKDNHPSKTNDNWSKNVSKSIKKNWENDQNRKDRFAKSIVVNIKSWRENNPEKFKMAQQRNAIKSKLKICDRIIYEGVTYIGWAEFYRATGYSKRHYVRYYLNGIPINFRNGANGPISLAEIHDLIHYICKHKELPEPEHINDYEEITSILIELGLLTKKNKKYFLDNIKEVSDNAHCSHY